MVIVGSSRSDEKEEVNTRYRTGYLRGAFFGNYIFDIYTDSDWVSAKAGARHGRFLFEGILS